MKHRRSHVFALGFLLSLAAACGSDEPDEPGADAGTPLDAAADAAEPDAAVDGGGIVRCDAHDDVERGDDGLADLHAAGDGHARAGRITDAADLLHGPKTRGKVGDFLLANDRVAFVIEDGRPSDGYNPFGGEIADAAMLGADGTPGQSLWGDVLWGMGPRLLEPDTVGVVADGSDGGEAIVRVVGTFVDIPLIKDLAATLIPLYLSFDGALDFVLAPGSDTVEMRVHLWNQRARREYVDLAIFMFLMGDGVEPFVPGAGFDTAELPASFRYLAFAGTQGVAYGFFPAEGFEYLLEVSSATLLREPPFFIDSCGELDLDLAHVAVAQSVDGLEAVRRVLDGEPAAHAVAGTVLDPAGAPVAGARVHLTTADGATHVTTATAGPDGTFALHAPAGRYQLWAFGDGPGARPVDVDVADTDVALPDPVVLAERGTLEVRVTDTEGAPLPGKVVLRREGLTLPPPMFGESSMPSDFVGLSFAAHGAATFALEPGRYELTIGRGFEYEAVVVPVDVVAGETTNVSQALDRVVDTTDWMSADFHVHSFWSPDSSDPLTLKVQAAAAEGLEIPVSTEHDWIGDFQPTVLAEGLDPFVRGMSGVEITTFSFGHFQAYPATPRPGEVNNGAFLWFDRTLADIAAEVRQDPADPVLQINHPRSASFGGYFNSVGFDPDTGEVEDQANWTTDFDAVEVFNGSSFDQNRDDSVRDWFRLIEMGVRPTATGNSDSHHATTSEIGYPRTYVLLGEDDPELVSPAAVAEAVRTGRAVVSGGAFLSVTAGGEQAVGETVAAEPGVPTVLHVTVQAPAWVSLARLEVFVNGQVAQTLELSGDDPVRFDADLEVTVDTDGWVVFVASGDEAMGVLDEGRLPFGATNPVYLDVP